MIFMYVLCIRTPAFFRNAGVLLPRDLRSRGNINEKNEKSNPRPGCPPGTRGLRLLPRDLRLPKAPGALRAPGTGNRRSRGKRA
jgi:hypothetical protein